MRTVLIYVASLIVYVVVDYLWLGVVARRFYHDALGDLLRPDVRIGVALLVYALLVAGILWFAVLPAVETRAVWRAIGGGALLGLTAYGAYDLTNLATLKGFPTSVAIVDMAWGTVLCAVVAAVGYAVGVRLLA